MLIHDYANKHLSLVFNPFPLKFGCAKISTRIVLPLLTDGGKPRTHSTLGGMSLRGRKVPGPGPRASFTSTTVTAPFAT